MEKTKQRLWQLDYLKAICAFNVVFAHNWIAGYKNFSIVFPFFIYVTVPVFISVHAFLNAQSFEKQGNRIRSWFAPEYVIRKLTMILIPYAFIYGAEVIYLRFIDKADWFTNSAAVSSFFKGGQGPGGYFIPLILQAIVFFPFLCKLVIRFPFWGSAGLLLLQTVLEAAAQMGYISPDIYRIAYFRFLVFTVGGILLHKYRNHPRNKLVYGLAVLSLAYIGAVKYTSVEIPLFGDWKSSALPIVFWVAAIVLFSLTHFKRLPEKADQAVCTIGAASFSIFLFQKLYYLIAPGDYLPWKWGNVIINVAVCMAAGCIMEKVIQKINGRKNETLYEKNDATNK